MGLFSLFILVGAAFRKMNSALTQQQVVETLSRYQVTFGQLTWGYFSVQAKLFPVLGKTDPSGWSWQVCASLGDTGDFVPFNLGQTYHWYSASSYLSPLRFLEARDVETPLLNGRIPFASLRERLPGINRTAPSDWTLNAAMSECLVKLCGAEIVRFVALRMRNREQGSGVPAESRAQA
jgi:hypothetical protein